MGKYATIAIGIKRYLTLHKHMANLTKNDFTYLKPNVPFTKIWESISIHP
jgi:hypothetical protein